MLCNAMIYNVMNEDELKILSYLEVYLDDCIYLIINIYYSTIFIQLTKNKLKLNYSEPRL